MSVKIKALVVDDSAFNRQTIKRMLESDPEIEVVGTAVDGMDAIAKTVKLEPDIITLDFEMPEMDGFAFLRWCMKDHPTPIIMVSSHSDSKTVFKALELGAVDFIAKPTKRASSDLSLLQADLVKKARGIKGMNLDILSRNLKLIESYKKTPETRTPAVSRVDLLAIGTSTGGPPALQIVLSKLPRDFPAPIVISQHMPRGFTKSFAERLDKLSHLRVREAREGDTIEKGNVYICPGGQHMKFKRMMGNVEVVLQDSQDTDKYVPSVDRMMMSAFDMYGERMMGVIMTGMGNDGKEGMIKLHANGCLTLAESEESAVVYGMPAEVINAGAAEKIAPLQDIAGEIIDFVMGERRKR